MTGPVAEKGMISGHMGDYHAERYRGTFAPSGAKSDPGDTDSLLDLLLPYRERLRPLPPDTVETCSPPEPRSAKEHLG